MWQTAKWVIGAVLIVATCSVASGQGFKKGDQVEAFFLNQWHPAVVLGTNKYGAVLVEFEFAGRAMQQALRRDQVRASAQAAAVPKMRFWSDATGKFRVRAALVDRDGASVKLRKEDGSEVSVPLDRLSANDQEYVAKLGQATPADSTAPADPSQLPTPERPALATFDATGAAQVTAFGGAATQELAADPLPESLRLPVGGAGFSAQFFDELDGLIPVGGQDGWLLASVLSKEPGGAGPTRLLWVSLRQRKVAHQQLLPPGEKVLDYDPSSQHLLTLYTGEFGEDRSELAVWKLAPEAKQAEPLVRWNSAPQDDFDTPGESPWGRLVSGSIALHQWSEQGLIAWDYQQRRAAYLANQEAFFGPEVVLSPGRKYLAIPEDNGLRLLDAASGRLLRQFPTERIAGVAFASDGAQVAALGQNELRVWTLNTGNPPQVYRAETIGSPFAKPLGWLTEGLFLADYSQLFSLRHQLTVWNYEQDFSTRPKAGRGGRARTIVGERLVYSVELRGPGPHGFAVGAVALPDEPAKEAERTLDPESLMVIRPGTAVQLQVAAGEFNPQVQAALEREIAANGWTLSPTATTVLRAEMKRGETKTVQYEMSDRTRQSATVTPHISTLTITVGQQQAWSAGTSTGPPPLVSLRPGETVQEKVGAWEKPNVAFFQGLDIPPKIIDPAKRNGLGTSLVGSQGVVPKQ